MVNDQTGQLAEQFGPNSAGAKAYIDYINAQGGVNGHKLDLTVYDSQSSDTVVQSDFKLAVSRGTFGFIEAEPLMESSIPYLIQKGLPVVGFGVVPDFYAAKSKNFFGVFGDIITKTSTEWAANLVRQGKTKIAVLSDPIPGDLAGAKSWAGTVPTVGGQLVFTDYNVDDTNTAGLLALAQTMKSKGVQGVISDADNTEPQLEADLHQVGDTGAIVEGGSNFSLSLPSQFGPSVDGYTFGTFVAPLLDTADPGVAAYVNAMKQYQPSLVYNGQAAYGWASAALFVEGLRELGNGPITASSYISKMNTLSGFTADGFIPPVSFPLFHQGLGACLSFSQIQNGKWTTSSGTPANPFLCGKAYPPGS